MKHKGQIFHDEIEMPGNHPVHLPLSMSATIDNGSAHLDPGVTVEPLLAQHRNERGEEGGGQARVEDRLDMDYGRVRAGPLREGSSIAGRIVPQGGIGDNLKELEAHFLEVRLEVFWASTMKAEATAENRPACAPR